MNLVMPHFGGGREITALLWLLENNKLPWKMERLKFIISAYVFHPHCEKEKKGSLLAEWTPPNVSPQGMFSDVHSIEKDHRLRWMGREP